MGRQTQIEKKYSAVEASVTNWNVRLDPHALPQQFRYHTGLGGDADEAAVVLDRNLATVSRRLPSGLPTAERMPIECFEGVAVRMLEPGEAAGDDVTIVVELLHRDPHLSLPLLVATSMEDVVADWRAWGRIFALPLLTVEADGSFIAVENRLGSVEVRPVLTRRPRSLSTRRRPRFLARRRIGTPALAATAEIGCEITSWE